MPQHSQPLKERLARVFIEFDLLDSIGVFIARFAGVEPPPPDDGPRLDLATLKRSVKAVAEDPLKRRIFLIFAALVIVFSTVVFVLLLNGTLADVYESIWSTCPGRPWTHVMRDHWWAYPSLAIALGITPFLVAPRHRWGRAFLTYVMFLIGFLGGHVIW